MQWMRTAGLLALAGLAPVRAQVPTVLAAPMPAVPAAPMPAVPAAPLPAVPAAPLPAVPAASLPAAKAPPAKAPVARTDVPKSPGAGTAAAVTPNAERVVTIAAIDKRTGVTRDYVGNPGQQFSFGALTVQVRTCETTPPWEQKLTGAFLLIDETVGKATAKRVYSGWMFAESPSLHPLEHARYDVWVKSCTMRFPETGPATVAAGSIGGADKGADKGAGADKPSASKAKKSAAVPSAEAN
jgi:hypothetical protein